MLRELRTDQGRTLREVSAAANVSLGYLSEVERGAKEASSEPKGEAITPKAKKTEKKADEAQAESAATTASPEA